MAVSMAVSLSASNGHDNRTPKMKFNSISSSRTHARTNERTSACVRVAPGESTSRLDGHVIVTISMQSLASGGKSDD